MNAKQTKEIEEIHGLLEQASNQLFDYWRSYSHMGTWQFWVLLILLVAPLILLFIYIDRSRAFRIGFYGLNVHVWFHYADLYTSTHGMTSFPYKVMPFLPISATLDTSLIPVCFMLVYQWTLKRNKNYYLYATGLSLVLSFLFKPALVAFGLFQMHGGTNYFHLFLFYVGIMLLSKWLTDLFAFLQHSPKGGFFKSKRPIQEGE